MAEPRHLSRAPIVEAIVDIRVKARPALQADDLAVLHRQAAEAGFPKAEKQQIIKTTVKPKKGQVTTEDRFLGYVCRSLDGLSVVQFRVDGFTFNRLRPYTRWELIWEVASAQWEAYRAVALPEAITRLALRYVNRIELPPDYNLERVLQNPPVVPLADEVTMSRYSSKVTVSSRETAGVSAHVAQIIEKKPGAEGAHLLLDIDAFVTCSMLTTDDDVARRVHDTFALLRGFKNR